MEQIKGAKYDEGKPRPSLVPVEGIEAIMQVREFGKAKYADAEDWRKVPREKWLDKARGEWAKDVLDEKAVDGCDNSQCAYFSTTCGCIRYNDVSHCKKRKEARRE